MTSLSTVQRHYAEAPTERGRMRARSLQRRYFHPDAVPEHNLCPVCRETLLGTAWALRWIAESYWWQPLHEACVGPNDKTQGT